MQPRKFKKGQRVAFIYCEDTEPKTVRHGIILGPHRPAQPGIVLDALEVIEDWYEIECGDDNPFVHANNIVEVLTD